LPSHEFSPSDRLSAVSDACLFHKFSVDGLGRVHFPSSSSFYVMRFQSASI
jgi:hypothetical protein